MMKARSVRFTRNDEPSRCAGVRNEASEGQQRNGREPNDTGSLVRPPLNDCLSALDSYKGRRNPGDKGNEGDDTESLGGSRTRCHRDEEQSKGDSDRSDGIQLYRSQRVLGDPNESTGREDADSTDGDDDQAYDEG
jgi:hypothetical protein